MRLQPGTVCCTADPEAIDIDADPDMVCAHTTLPLTRMGFLQASGEPRLVMENRVMAVAAATHDVQKGPSRFSKSTEGQTESKPVRSGVKMKRSA